MYAVLADVVVIVHLAFVLFVVLGGLLVLKWPRLAWLHLPAVAWGIFIELSGRICPLTPLENRLRLLASEQAYSGGFIEHYIMPVLYPAGLTPTVQYAFAAALTALNLAIYLRVWRRHQRTSTL